MQFPLSVISLPPIGFVLDPQPIPVSSTLSTLSPQPFSFFPLSAKPVYTISRTQISPSFSSPNSAFTPLVKPFPLRKIEKNTPKESIGYVPDIIELLIEDEYATERVAFLSSLNVENNPRIQQSYPKYLNLFQKLTPANFFATNDDSPLKASFKEFLVFLTKSVDHRISVGLVTQIFKNNAERKPYIEFIVESLKNHLKLTEAFEVLVQYQQLISDVERIKLLQTFQNEIDSYPQGNFDVLQLLQILTTLQQSSDYERCRTLLFDAFVKNESIVNAFALTYEMTDGRASSIRMELFAHYPNEVLECLQKCGDREQITHFLQCAPIDNHPQIQIIYLPLIGLFDKLGQQCITQNFILYQKAKELAAAIAPFKMSSALDFVSWLWSSNIQQAEYFLSEIAIKLKEQKKFLCAFEVIAKISSIHIAAGAFNDACIAITCNTEDIATMNFHHLFLNLRIYKKDSISFFIFLFTFLMDYQNESFLSSRETAINTLFSNATISEFRYLLSMITTLRALTTSQKIFKNQACLALATYYPKDSAPEWQISHHIQNLMRFIDRKAPGGEDCYAKIVEMQQHF